MRGKGKVFHASSVRLSFIAESCFLRNHASYEVMLHIIYCITQGAPGKLFFGKSSGFVKKYFHKISV